MKPRSHLRLLYLLINLVLAAVLVLASAPAALAQPLRAFATSPRDVSDAKATLRRALQTTPLGFTENQGQVDSSIRYYLSGGERSIWLAVDAIWVTLHQLDETLASADSVSEAEDSGGGLSQRLKLSFPGANPHPRLEPIARLETRVSYLIGADPAKWHTAIPVWGGVRYVDLYPGVDLDVSGQGGAWQWRVRAESGAALDQVQLRVEGADGLLLDGDRLQVITRLGEFGLPLLAWDAPVAPHGGPQLRDDQLLAPFAGVRPQSAALIPATDRPADLLYATFLGGGDEDSGRGIAVDGTGSAYVTGYTASGNFPAALGPGYDTGYNGGDADAFVVKINPAGTALLYATFLGGEDNDEGYGIAVDGTGSAYVTGYTKSSDFPAALGPGYDSSYGDHGDAFVVKLNPAGTALSYATFLGGNNYDEGQGIGVDGTGSAYVTGYTVSSDFPAALGPGYDTSFNGIGDAFVVKLNPAGTALSYATFLGGDDIDSGNGIAVDGSGSAYVTGHTYSSDFPAALGPGYDTSYSDFTDAFVVKINQAGTALLYATFLGGEDNDEGYGIAVDGTGSAYVTGYTNSSDFPAHLGPGYDTSFNFGDGDAFVVRLNSAGTGLSYATFIGEDDYDQGQGIAVDGTGTAYVTGFTKSRYFPADLVPGYDTSRNGDWDAFVVKLNPAGSALSYATFLGGAGADRGFGIAVDGADHAYVTGDTASSGFPAALGPGYDTSYNGSIDAFVVKLATGSAASYLPVVVR